MSYYMWRAGVHSYWQTWNDVWLHFDFKVCAPSVVRIATTQNPLINPCRSGSWLNFSVDPPCRVRYRAAGFRLNSRYIHFQVRSFGFKYVSRARVSVEVRWYPWKFRSKHVPSLRVQFFPRLIHTSRADTKEKRKARNRRKDRYAKSIAPPPPPVPGKFSCIYLLNGRQFAQRLHIGQIQVTGAPQHRPFSFYISHLFLFVGGPTFPSLALYYARKFSQSCSCLTHS